MYLVVYINLRVFRFTLTTQKKKIQVKKDQDLLSQSLRGSTNLQATEQSSATNSYLKKN